MIHMLDTSRVCIHKNLDVVITNCSAILQILRGGIENTDRNVSQAIGNELYNLFINLISIDIKNNLIIA